MTTTSESVRPAMVVLVDDDVVALGLMEEIVAGIPDSSAATFSAPADALAWCQACTPDVIVSDYQMPDMDGLQLLEHLRAEPHLRHVPIMVVTATHDREIRQRALEIGATDFLSKPLDAAEVAARITNMILVNQARRDTAVRAQELAFQVELARNSLVERERETIFRLAHAIEFRDWGSSQHGRRVAQYCGIIARGLGLADAERERLLLAAPMYDIGKAGVPDRVLLKPDRLDADELALVKQHPAIGHRLLSDSRSELLQYAAGLARTHHERVDGGGYPDGLAGDRIPLGGRIVAVADVFDALRSHRPYRRPWTADQAAAYLQANAGTQFDEACVRALLGALPDVLEVRDRFPDEQA